MTIKNCYVQRYRHVHHQKYVVFDDIEEGKPRAKAVYPTPSSTGKQKRPPNGGRQIVEKPRSFYGLGFLFMFRQMQDRENEEITPAFPGDPGGS
ncbi:hypothetical protein, partial [Paenibacillus sp. NRS-1780]|uniref:hypothetical protein n=1 Tax=Paenibacillus sp. NRS-1780 TaxID=3233904 RepID=UPI003D279B04